MNFQRGKLTVASVHTIFKPFACLILLQLNIAANQTEEIEYYEYYDARISSVASTVVVCAFVLYRHLAQMTAN